MDVHVDRHAQTDTHRQTRTGRLTQADTHRQTGSQMQTHKDTEYYRQVTEPQTKIMEQLTHKLHNITYKVKTYNITEPQSMLQNNRQTLTRANTHRQTDRLVEHRQAGPDPGIYFGGG